MERSNRVKDIIRNPNLLDPPMIVQGKSAFLGPAGQCDCACAVTPARSVETASFAGQYVAYPSTDIDLGNGYFAICAPTLQFSPLVLNHTAIVLSKCFESPRPLEQLASAYRQTWRREVVQSTLDRLVTTGLLVPEGHIAPCFAEPPITVTAWLHLTDACNLTCDYCYLSKTSKNMSLEVGQAAIDATFRSAMAHSYHVVKLKYAGGEPLLAFPRVVELHRYAKSCARRYGLELDGIVLSNGTLLRPEMVETMKAMGLRLMVSLDGLEEFHNCQRHYADGRGSFDAVARSIDLALSYGLIPEISITVSGRNAEGLPELMAWVLARNLPFSLNFYRENDVSSSYADLRLEREHIIEGALAAYKVIEENLPRRSLLSSLVDRANLACSHLRTCAVGQSYFVFDTEGQVAKCQMDIDTTITDCTDPDPLSTVRTSSKGIRNLRVEDKDECRECEWRYWCTGGCPLSAYRATGRYDAKSPDCSIYKALYPQAIRLEGLRLLEYADELEDIVMYGPRSAEARALLAD